MANKKNYMSLEKKWLYCMALIKNMLEEYPELTKVQLRRICCYTYNHLNTKRRSFYEDYKRKQNKR